MKKAASLLLCLFICLGLPNLTVSAMTSPINMEISLNESIRVDDSVVVQIKVSSLTEPLSALEFILHFDNTYFTPVITENNNDEMNAFLKKSPNSSWEQVCRYDSEISVYFLRFLTEDDANLLQNPDDFLVEIPFIAKKEGETFFSIEDSSIIGVKNDANITWGKGDAKVFTISPTSSIGNIRLKSSSSLKIYTSGDNAYITGIREKTSVPDFLDNFIDTDLTLLDADENPYTREICGTGMKICLFDGDTLLDGVTLVVKGDLDGDGTVSPIDYLFMRKYLLSNMTLNDTQIQAGLLTDTDRITAVDALKMKKHILGSYDIYER